MATLDPLPLKSDKWTKLRQSGCMLVDKTYALGALVRRYSSCYLARPHGMGKTMLCTQLEELFAHGVGAFEGFDIYDTWPEHKTYLVIRVSLGENKRVTVGKYEEWLQRRIIQAYVSAGLLAQGEIKVQEKLKDLLPKLTLLTTDREVVFLIDDWDAQIMHYLHDKAACDSIEQLWGQFTDWLNCKVSPHFTLITGTMSYSTSQVVLLDCEPLNNDSNFDDILGITPEELTTYYWPYITKAASRLELSTSLLVAQIESYYLGFNFARGEPNPVYSPLELNQFFAPLAQPMPTVPVFAPYWFDSRDHFGLTHWAKGAFNTSEYLVQQINQNFGEPIGVNPEELTVCYGPYITETARRSGEQEWELINDIEDIYLKFNFTLDTPRSDLNPLDLNLFFEQLTIDSESIPAFEPFWLSYNNPYRRKYWIKGKFIATDALVQRLDQEIEMPIYLIDKLSDFSELPLQAYLFETGYLTLKATCDGIPQTVVCPNRAIAQCLTNLLPHLDL